MPDHPLLLLVDDDAHLLQLLGMCLEGYGFDVITACNGLDALKYYDTYGGTFEAIISDVQMPQMIGYDFLKQIRNKGYQGRLVLMSGHLSVNELKNCIDIEISGFFHKPFEVHLLAALLSNKAEQVRHFPDAV